MRALVVLSLPSFDPAKVRPRGDGGGAMHAVPSVECSWPHTHSVRSAHSLNKWTVSHMCVCVLPDALTCDLVVVASAIS